MPAKTLFIFLRCDASGLGKRKRCFLQGVGYVVEENGRIEPTPHEMRLKMEMFRCCTACSSGQSDNLSGLNPIAYLYKILRLVAVERFETVFMLDNDTFSITEIRACPRYYTVESRPYIIVRFSLYVDSGVVAPAAIRTYNMSIRQWISPISIAYLL